MPTALDTEKLAKEVKTTYNKKRLLIELQMMELQFAKEDVAEAAIDQKQYPMISNLLSKIQQNTNNNIDQATLLSIKETVESIPEVNVRISTEVTTELEDYIHTWAVNNIDKVSVIDLSKDDYLNAGVSVSYQGNYISMTLEKLFKEALSATNG